MPAQRALDSVFRRFGRAMVYTASGDVGVPCRALLNGADDSDGLGSASFVTHKMVIEVRASEITPRVKGEFSLDGARFCITAAPKRIDPDRLVWTCLCDPL